MAGVGIALLPTFIVGPELARGALKTIEVGAATESADIFVAYPTVRGASAKVRALIEALKGAFGNPPYWERYPSVPTTRNPITRPR